MFEDVRQVEFELAIAALAAAMLGAQGSPVWSRTAELLLLSSPDVRLRHREALREFELVKSFAE